MFPEQLTSLDILKWVYKNVLIDAHIEKVFKPELLLLFQVQRIMTEKAVTLFYA